MTARLPAHIEIAALIRSVGAEGGFATVLHRGERDAGSLLVVCSEKGRNRRVFERMPDHSGHRVWTLSLTEDAENPLKIDDFLNRRITADPDLWIVELDIANGERFIGLAGTGD